METKNIKNKKMKIIKLKRVPYGHKNTLDEDREYQLLGESGFGPVGTKKEWQDKFPEAKLEIIEE